jgi:acyl-CoA hydrolase
MEVTDANVAGNVHGGVIMRLADTAAALAAMRHAGKLCVTVNVDEISFIAPVHVGDVLTLRASVNDVGTTSLEVGVRVEASSPFGDHLVHAATAYFVFVALDSAGQPSAVPPLLCETDDERRRQRAARLRREVRMAHRAAKAAGSPA